MISGTNNFNATNAYKVAQKMLDESSGSTSGTSGASGGGFGNMVADAAKSSISEVGKAEQVAADAVVGKASLNEVVNAVNSADVALKSVIAIRDKVINAYQDIIKMPM